LSRVDRQHRKPIIGLTGSVGAGKSAISQIFQSLGAAVIDADRLAHEQLGEPEVVDALVRWWGDSVLDEHGKVNRRAVGTIVFTDAVELAKLQDLLYPRIHRKRMELRTSLESDPNVSAIVFEVPKLYETGLDKECDVVVVVDADFALRAARVKESRGWDEAELSRREKLLEPLDMKRANADHVLVNNSRIEDLRPEVERILSTVLVSFS